VSWATSGMLMEPLTSSPSLVLPITVSAAKSSVDGTLLQT
jgi:hypothetical protein